MFKIIALADLSKDEENQEEETITQVTKEAQVKRKLHKAFKLLLLIPNFSHQIQETIAVSEYMRALSLKQSGKANFALGLFEDLLKTQVLSDVSVIEPVSGF